MKKELKDLLLVYHATIKDLQKQVTQMHKNIVTIDNSKKTQYKNVSKKAAPKKTVTSKKSKNKSIHKKSKKR